MKLTKYYDIFKMIAAGSKHSLAIKKDGSVVAWGCNEHGQCDVPEGNDFIDITAGESISLALTKNGYVKAWGDNSSNIPTNIIYKSISAGKFHFAGLTEDGHPHIIEWDKFGYITSDSFYNKKKFAKISSGSEHYLAVTERGFLKTCGYSSNRRLLPKGRKIIDISSGRFHDIALTKDGSILAWGGQCANDVPNGIKAIAISAGGSHSMAVTTNNSLVAWGWNMFGQCDVPQGNNFIGIATGDAHSLALTKEGIVVAWGSNSKGQCNIPDELT